MKIRMLLSLSCLLLALLLCPSLPVADVYHPQTPVYIKSQALKLSGEPGEPSIRIWRVASESLSQDGGMSIFFSPKESQSPLCRVDLSAAGEVIDSEIPGAAGNVLKKPDFLFVPGYPAPCDFFPQALLHLETAEASASFKVTRKIGGERFVDEICIQTRPVSAQKARANGWLKASTPDVSGPLRLVKAVNCRSGRLISLQVWPTDADWWVYEETPYRRSWQIDELND